MLKMNCNFDTKMQNIRAPDKRGIEDNSKIFFFSQ